MPRIYLRLTLIPLALFTAALLLIRAQPYDDHELRELLLPEGCPAPCFMGIRPGITTVDDAIKILEASGWVSEIDNKKFENNSGFILWNWRYEKPSWIREELRGGIYINDKVVHAIIIQSEFLLGETRLILGLPDMDFVGPPQDPSEKNFIYEAYYTQYVIRSWQPCNVTEPLRMTVEITIQKSTNYISKHVNFLSDLFRAC